MVQKAAVRLLSQIRRIVGFDLKSATKSIAPRKARVDAHRWRLCVLEQSNAHFKISSRSDASSAVLEQILTAKMRLSKAPLVMIRV